MCRNVKVRITQSLKDVRFWAQSGPRLAPNGKIWYFLKSVHSDWNLILSPEFVPFCANLTHFRPKSDTPVLVTATVILAYPSHSLTHTFFTFQSNVGNYYQWWLTFIMCTCHLVCVLTASLTTHLTDLLPITICVAVLWHVLSTRHIRTVTVHHFSIVIKTIWNIRE